VKDIVRQAFIDIRRSLSADRVIADPALNETFILRCREIGLSASAVDLNLTLLNLRKAGLLKGLHSTRTALGDDDLYRHASEIAVRFLEKRDVTTLDRIICDPNRAAEFDTIAADIAPGFSSLQYRWCALKLRKTRVLRPELLARVVKPVGVTIGSVDNSSELHFPEEQGLYTFYAPTETLYVGEASNLHRRLSKHLDHSDNKNLAQWFWANGFDNVRLEVQVLPRDTGTQVRKALEAELISTRRPAFNVQRPIIN
jgi:GIY-YIG catalytic domain